MRANVVDVDIPEETSQFAELKASTGDVGRNERVISSVFYKAAEWRKTDQWRGGRSQEQRTTNAKWRKTNTELEKKEQTKTWRTT